MVIRDVNAWPVLSTNQYARVIDAKLDEAVLLLKDTSCTPISASQAKSFVPQLQTPLDSTLQPYLVRAVSYSIPPLMTVARFDPNEGRIFIQQYTYNGETFMLYGSREINNAIVAYLPKAPQHIYPDAVWVGDGFGGTRADTR